jgi:hypothetical protein
MLEEGLQGVPFRLACKRWWKGMSHKPPSSIITFRACDVSIMLVASGLLMFCCASLAALICHESRKILCWTS